MEIHHIRFDDKIGFCATRWAKYHWLPTDPVFRASRARRRVGSIGATGSISHTSRVPTTRVLARDKFYLLSRTQSSAPLISNVRDQRRRATKRALCLSRRSQPPGGRRTSGNRLVPSAMRTTGFVGSWLLRGYKSAAVRTSLTVPFTKNQPADTCVQLIKFVANVYAPTVSKVKRYLAYVNLRV